jgi:hypothetical protein
MGEKLYGRISSDDDAETILAAMSPQGSGFGDQHQSKISG